MKVAQPLPGLVPRLAAVRAFLREDSITLTLKEKSLDPSVLSSQYGMCASEVVAQFEEVLGGTDDQYCFQSRLQPHCGTETTLAALLGDLGQEMHQESVKQGGLRSAPWQIALKGKGSRQGNHRSSDYVLVVRTGFTLWKCKWDLLTLELGDTLSKTGLNFTS